jgi:hypothetical protein
MSLLAIGGFGQITRTIAAGSGTTPLALGHWGQTEVGAPGPEIAGHSHAASGVAAAAAGRAADAYATTRIRD